jgi:chromatin segregation and condensation protein Rec8/ScpA/Scc1 (kleisin family)
VVTLLALLELVRLGQARARQVELFGDIVIERGEGNPAGEGDPVAEPAPQGGGA